MDRRWGILAVAAVLFAVLLASVATAGDVQLWHEPADGGESSATEVTPPTESAPDTTAPERAGDSGPETPFWILLVARLVMIVVVLAVIVAGVILGWQHRPRLRWRREQQVGDFTVLPDVARAVTDEAAEQRAALQRGTPRNAIVECWVRLEATVVRAGIRRDDADTPSEFTARVLGAYDVDRRAVDTLADLYREARFSTHDMTEVQRQRAIDALDSIHEGLLASLAVTEPLAGTAP